MALVKDRWKRKATYLLCLLGAFLGAIALNSIAQAVDVSSICRSSNAFLCSDFLVFIPQLISAICALAAGTCLLAFFAFFLDEQQRQPLVNQTVFAQFSKGSDLTELDIGFRVYPDEFVNPEAFKVPSGVCRVACSSATVSREGKLFSRKRDETHWFAIVSQQPVAEIVGVQSYLEKTFETKRMPSPLLDLSASRQINPSLMKGTVVGPFGSLAHIQAWFGSA